MVMTIERKIAHLSLAFNFLPSCERSFVSLNCSLPAAEVKESRAKEGVLGEGSEKLTLRNEACVVRSDGFSSNRYTGVQSSEVDKTATRDDRGRLVGLRIEAGAAILAAFFGRKDSSIFSEIKN